MDTRYQFDCPKCNKERFYSTKKAGHRAQRNNRLCIQCAAVSDDLRKRRSENATGEKNHFARDIHSGANNPFYGHRHTEATKAQLSQSRIGLAVGEKNGMFGRKHTEATKTKLRQSVAERARDKFGVSKDKGSDEFFSYFNQRGFNFKEANYKQEIGYFADGYDEQKHSWMEFDTPYHDRPSQKAKDLVRQQRIIAYFEKIGKPLAQFSRFSVSKNKLKVVYRGKHWFTYLFGYTL